MLTSILEAANENELPGPWNDCSEELEELAYARRGRCDTARLECLCDRIAAVLERANTAYAAALAKFQKDRSIRPAPAEATTATGGKSININVSPLGSISEPHIQNTTEKKIYDLYKVERRAADAAQFDLSGAGIAGEEGLGTEPESAATSAQDGKINAQPIDLTTIRMLCPGFWEWVYVRTGAATWDDVIAAAGGVVRAGLHIPESTWRSAARLLGRERAAVAVALIFEKNAEGIITSPGAYLNSMVTRAEQGKFHLEPSLFHWRKPGKRGAAPPMTTN